MNWVRGDIDGVQVQPATMYADDRGWLCEMFRSDEIEGPLMPVMAYVSQTHVGATRGPHEHREQSDRFGFIGPGDFRLKMWDARQDSPTMGHVMTLTVGAANPVLVTIPGCAAPEEMIPDVNARASFDLQPREGEVFQQ